MLLLEKSLQQHQLKLTEYKISEILIAINQHGVTMLPFEPEIMNEALYMVKKNWKLGDSIHYVTMKKNAINEIVTDDSHFDNLDGIKRINILNLSFE